MASLNYSHSIWNSIFLYELWMSKDQTRKDIASQKYKASPMMQVYFFLTRLFYWGCSNTSSLSEQDSSKSTSGKSSSARVPVLSMVLNLPDFSSLRCSRSTRVSSSLLSISDFDLCWFLWAEAKTTDLSNAKAWKVTKKNWVKNDEEKNILDQVELNPLQDMILEKHSYPAAPPRHHSITLTNPTFEPDAFNELMLSSSSRGLYKRSTDNSFPPDQNMRLCQDTRGIMGGSNAFQVSWF